MKYRAVIFDLFGTLVPNFSEQEYHQTVLQMASILTAPPEIFWHLWSETFNDRVLGILPDIEADIIYICKKLGLDPDNNKIKAAAKIRFDYELLTMVPRPDAVEVLSTLKSKRLKIGLISDCSYEAPAIWNDTPLAQFFDSAVFSCSVGMRKPDPRIYQLSLGQLGVGAESCLYIGDGSSRELTGAYRVGMQVAQLRIPGEDNPDVYRVDKEDWQGTAITSLTDILNLVE